MTRNRLTLTRLIIIHLLLMALAIAFVFIWRPGHAQTIGEPYPAHCIYWDGAQAYDAPCQDFAVYAPLALTGWDWFGPPPTPAPWEGE